MITNAGLNHVLDVTIHDGTKVATWYIGLIRDDNYTGLSASDTMSSHAGWEEATEYSETARQEWTEDAGSSQSIANTTEVTFTINSDQTIKGLFVTSSSTKGGTTGTLLATALFSGGDREMVAGQLLKVTLQINGQDASAT